MSKHKQVPNSLFLWDLLPTGMLAVHYCRGENATKSGCQGVGGSIWRLHISSYRLTDAFSLVRHSDRLAEETGRFSQVTGAGIDDPVVSTQVLLRWRRIGANPITRHTVCVVCLVHDACGAARAQDIPARFWRQRENDINGAPLTSSLDEAEFTHSCICPGTARPGRVGLCISPSAERTRPCRSSRLSRRPVPSRWCWSSLERTRSAVYSFCSSCTSFRVRSQHYHSFLQEKKTKTRQGMCA